MERTEKKRNKIILLLLLWSITQTALSQNVGIGTTTPVSKLEVRNGTLTLTNTQSSTTLVINRANTITGSSSQILFQDNGTTKWAIGGTNIGNAGANDLSLYNYNIAANALTISTANNNVGIGTAAAGTRLEVAGGYDGDGILISGSTYGPKDIGLQLGDDGGHSAFLGLASAANAWMSGIAAGDVVLGTRSGKVWIGNGASSAFPSMVISGNGNVGIGILNPGATLHVAGGGSTTGLFSNSGSTNFNYALEGDCVSTPGEGIGVAGFAGAIGVRGWTTLNGNGDRHGVEGIAQGGIGINCGVYGEAAGTVIEGIADVAYGVFGHAYGATTIYAGYFEGDVLTTGVYQTSDRKFKNDIRPLNGALSIISQLKPSVYTFKTTEFKQTALPEGLQYGLIADEVQQVIPGAVKKAIQPAQYENGAQKKDAKLSEQVTFNAVNYTMMIPVLIGAVKEQQVIIADMQKKIDVLEKIIAQEKSAGKL